MLEVIDANGWATIQDLGRRGWQRFGVPVSGPMDPFALQAANLLAGNEAGAAAVEVGAGDLVLRATQDCVIAATGAGYELSVHAWQYPLWGACFVRAGWNIQLNKIDPGMWAYLAVAGGLTAATVLGSRSTYVRGHFGGHEGRSLRTGDMMHAESPAHALMELAGRTVAPESRPAYSAGPTVDVILGPQSGYLTEESLDTFFSSAYRVSSASDRMGYRLEGPRLEHRGRADVISEGMVVGSIQVPSDGAPIAMMADCATTGGYPKIACVIRADLPLLAQCRIGKDQVRFRQTTIDAAQEKYRRLMGRLKTGVIEAEA